MIEIIVFSLHPFAIGNASSIQFKGRIDSSRCWFANTSRLAPPWRRGRGRWVYYNRKGTHISVSCVLFGKFLLYQVFLVTKKPFKKCSNFSVETNSWRQIVSAYMNCITSRKLLMLFLFNAIKVLWCCKNVHLLPLLKKFNFLLWHLRLEYLLQLPQSGK